MQSSIVRVSNEGAIVTVAPNYIFQINVDRLDTSLWLSGDNVLVCAESFLYQGKPLVYYTLRDLNASGDDPEGATGQLLN